MPEFKVETEFEPETGRWIAEEVTVGALVYGDTEEEAIARAVALAREIVVHGELRQRGQ